MKNRISTILCIALTVALVVCAIGLGAVRGWQQERDNALAVLSAGGALANQLDTRIMDAANLTVVAARHLSADDSLLLALQAARTTLLKADTVPVDEVVAADANLSETAATLAEVLPAMDSVKASPRDQAYISTLTRTLSGTTDLYTQYAAKVTDYNDRLASSLTGRLAMLLGVQPLSLQ